MFQQVGNVETPENMPEILTYSLHTSVQPLVDGTGVPASGKGEGGLLSGFFFDIIDCVGILCKQPYPIPHPKLCKKSKTRLEI